MPMSDTTLSDELKNLALYTTENEAATAWASAFHTYFKEALAGVGGPVIEAGLVDCQAAMSTALAGMSQVGQGALKLQAGILAYWGAIIPATAWATCTLVTPPPGLTGLAAALTTVFATNQAEGKTKDVSANEVALSIHALNSSGGIATFPVPPGGIGPQPIT